MNILFHFILLTYFRNCLLFL